MLAALLLPLTLIAASADGTVVCEACAAPQSSWPGRLHWGLAAGGGATFDRGAAHGGLLVVPKLGIGVFQKWWSCRAPIADDDPCHANLLGCVSLGESWDRLQASLVGDLAWRPGLRGGVAPRLAVEVAMGAVSTFLRGSYPWPTGEWFVSAGPERRDQHIGVVADGGLRLLGFELALRCGYSPAVGTAQAWLLLGFYDTQTLVRMLF